MMRANPVGITSTKNFHCLASVVHCTSLGFCSRFEATEASSQLGRCSGLWRVGRVAAILLAALAVAVAFPSASAAQAPPIPTVTVTDHSAAQINLSWSDTGTVTSYNLQMSADGVNYYSESAMLGLTTTTFTDTVNVNTSTPPPPPYPTLAAGTLYYYEVEAFNGSLTNGWSAPAFGLTAVTGVTATFGFWQNTITWSAGPSTNGYNVDRGLTTAGPFTKLNSSLLSTTSYTDTTAIGSTKYVYRIEAKDTATGTVSTYTPGTSVTTGSGVQCGNLTSGYTTIGPYVADTDYSAGGVASTTNAINNTSYQALYKDWRDSGSGTSFTYTLPVPNGSYRLDLQFAEIGTANETTSKRLMDITVEGSAVYGSSNPFDILAHTGGQSDYAYDLWLPVTVTSNQLVVEITEDSASAKIPAVNAIALLSPASAVGDAPEPDYAAQAIPRVVGGGGASDGPASTLDMIVPSGVLENSPGPDIWSYNPTGPSAGYQRTYRSSLVGNATHSNSPSLSPGWVDNYDYTITPGTQSGVTWQKLTLQYPDNAMETFTPTLSGGTPTGAFSQPNGAPYLFHGTALTGGAWQSLTMTFKDRSVWTFTPNTAGTVYFLKQITNVAGHYIALDRDYTNGGRIENISNDAGTPLLVWSYSGLPSVITIQDQEPMSADQRQVDLGFNSTTGQLDQVTQLVATGTGLPSSPDNITKWIYGYQSVSSLYYLDSVGEPDPNAGSGFQSTPIFTTATVDYNTAGPVPVATDIVDDEGADTDVAYYGTFEPDSIVSIINPSSLGSGTILSYTQYFQPSNLGDTGFTDANNNTASYVFGASNNPYVQTQGTDRDGKVSSAAMNDAYGNVANTEDPRQAQTILGYDTTDFPHIGQVNSVQDENVLENPIVTGIPQITLQSSTIGYYATTGTGAVAGMVSSVTSPLPGTVGGSSSVTTTYTYTSLGDPSVVTAPGPNSTVAAAGMTNTTYTTTTYSYASTEALGEPTSVAISGTGNSTQPPYASSLSVPSSYNSVTYDYSYDDKGNQSTFTDAAPGGTTTYYYNIADQVIEIEYPPTTGTARSYVTYNYEYPGGPLDSTTLTDETGTIVREVDYAYGHEGETTSVTGSTQPVYYTYDGLYRVTSEADGSGNVTDYSYDDVGNLSQITYPNAANLTAPADTITYTYDANQYLLTRTDGRGVVTTYDRGAYTDDPDNALHAIDYNVGSTGVPSIGDVTFSYDSLGRTTGMSDGTANKTYSYDDLGNPLEITTDFTPSGGASGQDLTYAYWPNGERASMDTPVGTYGYQYDGLDRLAELSPPWSGAGAQFHRYYANGWLDYTYGPMISSSTQEPLFYTQYTYDPRGFLTTEQNTHYDPYYGGFDVTSTINNTLSPMTYDGGGNRLSEAITFNNLHAGPYANRNISYGYDTGSSTPSQNLDELTSVAVTNNGGSASAYGSLPYTNDYTYNTAWFMAALQYPTTIYGTGHSLSFTPNVDNQLANTGYAFDGDGNPTTYNSASLGFDPEDRLVSISSPSFSAGYAGDDTRTYKTTSATGTTYYVHDTDGFPVVEENSSYGDTSSIEGPDGVRSTEVPGNPTNFYGLDYDPQGNLINVTTNNQVYHNVGDCLFDPYGLLLGNYSDDSGATHSVYTQWNFGGQWGYYTDIETGLYLLGHRYYAPGTGRFLNRDPIGYKGGENLYNAFGGNPVNESDSTGNAAGWFWNTWLGGEILAAVWNVKLAPGTHTLGNAPSHVGEAGPTNATTLSAESQSPARASADFRRTATAASLGFVGYVSIGVLTEGLGRAAGAAFDTGGALNFAQKTASAGYNERGWFAGRTIGAMVEDLRSGAVKPSSVPVRFVTINGSRLIVNTRSALALIRAGIPTSDWNLVDMTSNKALVSKIQQRLVSNGLTSAGTDVLRITGGPEDASSLR
jgi:RHS repeat-associated protein